MDGLVSKIRRFRPNGVTYHQTTGTLMLLGSDGDWYFIATSLDLFRRQIIDVRVDDIDLVIEYETCSVRIRGDYNTAHTLMGQITKTHGTVLSARHADKSYDLSNSCYVFETVNFLTYYDKSFTQIATISAKAALYYRVVSQKSIDDLLLVNSEYVAEAEVNDKWQLVSTLNNFYLFDGRTQISAVHISEMDN